MLERLPLLTSGISLRPLLACEISPTGVLAARPDGDALVTQFVPLAPDCLAPGTKFPNILQRAKVVAAIRTAVNAVAERGRNLPGGRTLPGNRALTAIVPDAAVRVLLLDFDTLPSKRAEVISILRFRLRKLVTFDVEDAVISYQVASHTAEQTRVLVTVTPKDVLLEYESVIRESGFFAGVVLPSTLAATTLLGTDPALVVNRNGNTLTTAIVRGEELLLHRALEFELADEHVDGAAPAGLPGPAHEIESLQLQPRSHATMEALREDDIRQTVSVALAYYEDTLAQNPDAIYYIGPGTAEEFALLLGEGLLAARVEGESAIAVRALLPGSASTLMATLDSGQSASGAEPGGQVTIYGAPQALLAPVAGALFNG